MRVRLGERLSSPELPSRILPLAALPRLPNGKIDRKALVARDLPESIPARGAPRDDIERHLAEKLGQLLKVPELGTEDDLFERGADSLTAVEVVAVIERDFNVDLSTATMWNGSATVAALADLVRAARGLPVLSGGDESGAAVRPTPYTLTERAIDAADMIELALLPVVKALAALSAEPGWRRIADGFAGLTVPLRPGRVAALQRALAPRFAGTPQVGRQVLRAIHAAALERRMRMVSSRHRWRAPIELNGQAHLEAARARGRGAVLWLSPAAFASIIGLVAIDRAGLPVSMVTRPEHGLSTSKFGQAVLNRFYTPVGGSGGVEQIFVDGMGRKRWNRCAGSCAKID